MSAALAQHPLVAYFVLAYALSWAMVALIPVSFVFALLALFGPAAAALIVTGLTAGRGAVAELLKRLGLWRVGVLPYALAIGAPLVVALAAQVAYSVATGAPVGVVGGTPIPLTVLLGVLVVGEEVGWRGFALPHLQARYSGLVASLILGTLWAAWHLANATIPGLQAYWYGFPAFLVFVVAQTVLFTWLWNRTRGSLLLAWVLHASINVTNSLFFVGDQVTQWLLAGAGFAILAVILVAVAGRNLARDREPAATQAPAQA